MGWARIEIEIDTERHDIQETMAFFVEHFKADDGAPTATVELLGFGPDDEAPLRLTTTQQARMGLQTTAARLGMQGGSISSPVPTVSPGFAPLHYGYTKGDLEAKADEILAHWGTNKKIQAIKDMRSVSNLGLKEAKDAIEAAVARLPKGTP